MEKFTFLNAQFKSGILQQGNGSLAIQFVTIFYVTYAIGIVLIICELGQRLKDAFGEIEIVIKGFEWNLFFAWCAKIVAHGVVWSAALWQHIRPERNIQKSRSAESLKAVPTALMNDRLQKYKKNQLEFNFLGSQQCILLFYGDSWISEMNSLLIVINRQ